MTLQDVLNKRRSTLLRRWRDEIVDTYPQDTRRFLRKEKDRFANPVGHSIAEATEALYAALLPDGPAPGLEAGLDGLLRIRAVQDFKPSEALSFIKVFKGLFREELKRGDESRVSAVELRELEDRIDDLTLTAFDVYCRCREKLHEVRLNEMTRQVSRLLARANMTVDIPERAPEA